MNHEQSHSLDLQKDKRMEELIGEVEYYKSLLFADMNPQIASILNALRLAREAVEENERLKNGGEIERLRRLCAELERENKALKQALAPSVTSAD
jgi:cell shape-determining protein MreC